MSKSNDLKAGDWVEVCIVGQIILDYATGMYKVEVLDAAPGENISDAGYLGTLTIRSSLLTKAPTPLINNHLYRDRNGSICHYLKHADGSEEMLYLGIGTPHSIAADRSFYVQDLGHYNEIGPLRGNLTAP